MATTEARMKQLTGAYADLNKSNMLVGEMAVPSDHVPVVRNGVNSWEDISTVDTMNDYIDLKTQDIVDELTQGIDVAITNAENATNTAITTAENLETTYAPRLQNVENATVNTDIALKSLTETTAKTDIALKDLAEASKSVIPDVKVSTYNRSSVLSSNAREGQMNVKVSGNTMKNEVVNGNFANGTTGWTASFGTIMSVNNICEYTVTTNGRSDNRINSTAPSIIVGKKYYLKYDILPKYNTETKSYIGGVYVSYITPIANVWNNVSGIITAINTDKPLIFQETLTQYSVGDIIKIKDVICIDMGSDSSNPLYNKTVAEMDAIAPYYFDGFSDVKAGVVRTVGKNLFDKFKSTIGYTVSNTTGLLSTNSTYDTTDFIRVNSSTSYIKSNTLNLAYYDVNKVFISGTTGSATFTTPVGCVYVRCSVLHSAIDTFQVELGSTTTTYEPYSSTIKYLPYVSLKSLPNNTKDYIDNSRYVKNISDVKTLVTSDFTELITSFVNFDVVRLKVFSDAKTSSGGDMFNGKTYVVGYPEKPFVDATANIGTHYYGASSNIIIVVAKGTYANLAAAQTALAGTKIIYQLATPIITEILPNTVKSSPNGSVQYLNVRGEVGYYGTNIAVTNSALPIKSLSSVKKISIADGSETNIDLSTCTIASGGLSFTSTALTNGCLVDWNYEFDSALSTTPVIDYEYQNGYNGNVVIGTTTLQIKGGVIIGVVQS